jgi:MFS family permease
MAGISAPQVRWGLRFVTAAWMFGVCWYFATTNTAMAVFGTQVGFSDFHFGLLAMLPFLGTIAQPLASYYLERYRNRKAVFLWWMSHNRWPWVLVALAPYVLYRGWVPGVVLAIVAVMSLCGALGTPAWVSWMADFVPRKRRGQYFATRTQYAMASLAIGTLVIGLALDWADRQGPSAVLPTYSVILVVATIFGLLDIQLFRWVPEPRMAVGPQLPAWGEVFSEPFGNRSYRPILVHNMLLTFSITVLGSFITLHSLHFLHFSKLATSVMIGVMPPLGYVLTSRIWGKAMDRWGRKPVLTVTLLFSVITASGWLVAGPGDAWWVAFVCLTGGGFWSGLETSNFNLVLAYTGSGRTNGTCYQALLAVCMGVAGVIAGLLGGGVAGSLTGMVWVVGPLHLNNYMVLLLISVSARLIDLVLVVPRIEDRGAIPFKTAIRMILADFVRTVNGRIRPDDRLDSPGDSRSRTAFRAGPS